MPCYERRVTTVVLENINNMDAFKAALESLGAMNVVLVGDSVVRFTEYEFGPLAHFRDGNLVVQQGSKFTKTAVKKAYSKEVVRFNAKAKGWKVQDQGEQLRLVRRTY